MKISKEKWGKIFDALASDYQMYAPQVANGEVNFSKVKQFSDVKQNYINTKIPGKALFFPQYEKLFSYKKEGKDFTLEKEFKVEDRIVFGIRPCDVKALLIVDKVFKNDQYTDPYYCDRRDNTVIIGVACSQIAPTCFCSTFEIAPASSEGSDLFLIDLGDSYQVEVITEKGKTIADKLEGLEELTSEDQAKVETAQNAKTFSLVDVSTITSKLDNMFEHPFWDSLHEKCIGCNACTFTCPTCHCFDILEEYRKDVGTRVRTWDSCMAPLFTKHGSGHNPRDEKKTRWRQRMMHKFNYYVHNNEYMACVGCGRCIKACPVNMDIRLVIEGVNKAEEVVK